MKTILLIAALAGFTIGSSYAQNKDCCCKKTAVRHKVVKHKAVAKVTTNNDKPVNDVCYSYKKHNIAVTECTGAAYYEDFANNGYIQDHSYLGYYPTESTPAVTESVAPLSNHLVVTSYAFTDNGVLPSKYTCEGEHASPPLKVDNIPIGAKSLAVVMYDPHANDKGSLTYWLVWNIDTSGVIPENFISDNQSINAGNSWGYQAACPVSGTHSYHFMVYALDTKLQAGRHTTKAALEKDMNGHILARGELTGIYNKHLEK